MNKREFLRTLAAGGLGLMGSTGMSPLRVSDGVRPAREKNWMWLRNARGYGRNDWARLFAAARTAGIDAVLPEVYNSRVALYRSDRHPQDVPWLEQLAPIAQEEGLELHAWMWMMPCNQESIWREHPEWYAVNRKGEPSWERPAYVEYYRFLCPSRPDVQEFLRGTVAEVAAMDGIAGVHLDYIRYPDVILATRFQRKYGIVQDKEYPQYDYCYCDVCRRDFHERSGTDPLRLEDPASNAEWVQFRYDRITDLVNGVLIPGIRSQGKTCTAAVFPNWESVRQQWTAWDVGAVLPMLYHGFYDRGMDWIEERTRFGVEAFGGSAELYAGLFVDHLDPDTLPLAIDAARRGGASGISLFEGRMMDDRLWRSLKNSLSRF